MKITKRKFIGITIMIIGIIGFIFYNNIKNEYRIFEKRYSSEGLHQAEIRAKVTHDYQFFFWGVDEQFPSEHGFPEFEGEFKIVDKNNKLLFDTLFLVNHSVDKGGIIRAQDGFYFRYSPAKDEMLKININIKSGDYLDLEVHEDLPESVALTPPLFIFVFIIGLIIYLRKKQKKYSKT
ncbi:MAG: hypothetical protein K8R41_02590 [Bacteroidales bacterium]|nr:hypothetical protein [Bacteroidales bacterium]